MIESYKKKAVLVDMVLYDGTSERAAFIESWSGGCARIVGDDLVIAPVGIVIAPGDVAAIKPDHYIVKGGEDDFYPMPRKDAHLYYDINKEA